MDLDTAAVPLQLVAHVGGTEQQDVECMLSVGEPAANADRLSTELNSTVPNTMSALQVASAMDRATASAAAALRAIDRFVDLIGIHEQLRRRHSKTERPLIDP